MKKSLLLLLLSFVLSFRLQAQVLEFYHAESKKTITIRTGQAIALTYKGYNGQLEFIKQTVTEITDSTLVLGLNYSRFNIKSVNKGPLVNMHKIVKLQDIQGFRRMTLGRQLLKSGLSIGAVIGSYTFLYRISNNSNYTPGEVLLISIGVAFGSKILLDKIMPENTKFEMKDGWTYRIIND
jgi:hypothetical protein